MEQLLHYVWKHKMFPPREMKTAEGLAVEVIDVGLHNSNSGPDFFNAKVRIDGMLWVGNVEIHDKSSDWYLHGHDKDAAYNNVILHVVETIDAQVKTQNGEMLMQMQLEIPGYVRQHYHELQTTDEYPPCYRIVPNLPRLMIHSWLTALHVERLEQKTDSIRRRLHLFNGDWEKVYFTTLARNFGFGINGDAFELWAESIPLHDVDHHRDNIFQIEAIFFGQAGLLSPESVPEKHMQQAMEEGYFEQLRKEYLYLSHKFNLSPIDVKCWRFLRLRPQNFPYIRISQLANLYYHHRALLSQMIESTTIGEMESKLQTTVSPYWQTHYVFGSESGRREKRLSNASMQVILINTVIPMLFAYGRYKNEVVLCDRALSFLEQVKRENNHIVRMWEACGLKAENAADSQALIQLKNEYCDKRDCLRCRIGSEYLRKR